MRWLILMLTLGWLHGLDVQPLLLRVELPGTAVAERRATISAPSGTRILAITGDCRCVTATTPLPLTFDALGRAEIALRISGAQPGLHPLTVHSTDGTATITVQVVGGGLGEGAAALADAIQRARAAGGEAVVIVHDLGGAVRNCGCSTGSLGGIDVLAALPEAWRTAGGPAARFVLTGAIEDVAASMGRPVAPMLTLHGWSVADPAISTDPRDLARPEVAVVVSATGPAHARRITPLMGGGAIALVVCRDAAGGVVATVPLPIDRTLPRHVEVLAEFTAAAVVVPVAGAQPSTSCSGCHQAAHAAWLGSAHARAFSSLVAGDRTTGCVGCHVTPLSPQAGGGAGAPEGVPAVAADVHCQACHTGAEAHAAAGGARRTGGTVDCRSCHDARHDPGFDPVAAWLRMQHGK